MNISEYGNEAVRPIVCPHDAVATSLTRACHFPFVVPIRSALRGRMRELFRVHRGQRHIHTLQNAKLEEAPWRNPGLEALNEETAANM